MTITEHHDPKDSMFHVHLAMTDRQVHDMVANVPTLIVEQLVDMAVRELRPLIQENLKIDWLRINRAVEDEIVKRIADTFQPEKK
jgi:hypothetical protein